MPFGIFLKIHPFWCAHPSLRQDIVIHSCTPKCILAKDFVSLQFIKMAIFLIVFDKKWGWRWHRAMKTCIVFLVPIFLTPQLAQVQFIHALVFIGPRCPWGPIYGSWSLKLTERLCADLTDVTLADEDSNSIPSNDVNRAFLGNVAMQVAPSDGQHWN